MANDIETATRHAQLLAQATALHQAGKLNEAHAIYQNVLTENPQHTQAMTMLGAIYIQAGQHEQGLTFIRQSLAINPKQADAYYIGGIALQALKNLDHALDFYNQAILLKPDFADAHNNHGNTLRDLGRLTEALSSFDYAIRLNPQHLGAVYNRGNTLSDLKRFDEAVVSFDQALKINPNFADIVNNRGNALQTLNRFEEAITDYTQAIQLNAHNADTYKNRGVALHIQRRYEEALQDFDQALSLNPDYEFLSGLRLMTQQTMCDWGNWQEQSRRLIAGIQQGKKCSSPMPALAISASAAVQKQCAEIYVAAKYPASNILVFPQRNPANPKVRLGYFSPDFKTHPVAFLTAGLLERHDRSRFEVYAFSYSHVPEDPIQKRILAACDHFIDVSKQSTDAVLALARELQIDIAIDLTGHTQHARTELFAARLAPIQVNYLGFPATMGASFMDYIIGDALVIPEHQRMHYSEKIAYLPHCFQANDDQRPIASATTRAAHGLKDSDFVFCCFNNGYKLNPVFFNLWLNLLKSTENTVLWLLGEHPQQIENLKQWAAKQQVSPDRLIFAGRLPYAEHLARYQLADLVLDVLPFNGGTNTSDALWGGAPVLTCSGDAFASRMAASLLHAVGLPELVAPSLEDYANMALDFARHPEKTSALKQKLKQNISTHPLFNTTLFTRHLENAYQQMMQRQQANLPPEHIFVQA
ncbi:MAG: tetratricopeptide repeat protein [Methylophilaceae bacterium]